MTLVYCKYMKWLCLLVGFAVVQSCSSEGFLDGVGESPAPERVVKPVERRTFLVYSAGFNSLSKALSDDIDDIVSGYLPWNGSGSDVVLVYSKSTENNVSDYAVATPSYMVRLSSDMYGNPVRDTLMTWPSTFVASSASTVRIVLDYVRQNYPSSSYGMLFTSHASGWLPSGYYTTNKITSSSQPSSLHETPVSLTPVSYADLPQEPGFPAVKSIGVDNIDAHSAYEMEIEDFARAIPFHLDYMIFDACLMGGVETAYALKDRCSKIIFSPTEVLSDGLVVYTELISRLLGSTAPDLAGVCDDAYAYYSSKEDMEQSLTISMVDCTHIDEVATAVKDLSEKYSGLLASVKPSSVQRYYRFGKHWFYDLEDIFVKSGVIEADLAPLRDAMSSCVVYKAATERFLSIDITDYSGLSMYLPCDGNADLDGFYKTLSWNEASSLVR